MTIWEISEKAPPGEPIDTDVNAAVTQLLQVQCDGVMCVGGSWMLDSEWIKNGDWARIQECTAEALALLD